MSQIEKKESDYSQRIQKWNDKFLKKKQFQSQLFPPSIITDRQNQTDQQSVQNSNNQSIIQQKQAQYDKSSLNQMKNDQIQQTEHSNKKKSSNLKEIPKSKSQMHLGKSSSYVIIQQKNNFHIKSKSQLYDQIIELDLRKLEQEDIKESISFQEPFQIKNQFDKYPIKNKIKDKKFKTPLFYQYALIPSNDQQSIHQQSFNVKVKPNTIAYNQKKIINKDILNVKRKYQISKDYLTILENLLKYQQ